jgi:predicted DNA-binding transcriptional regulator AlpA
MSRPTRIPDRPDVLPVAAVQARPLSDMRPVPRRGLSRYEAAMYVGIGASKFDEMVADRRMPKPRRIDGRKVWDVRELDLAFDALPRENEPDIAPDETWADFDGGL